MKKVFGYCRVSTREQNLSRQIDALIKAGVNERDILMDKMSGKDLDRTSYQTLKQMLRPGDELVIKSLDRLSRSKADIKNELEYFKQQKIRVKILDLPTSMIEVPDGQEWIIEMVNNILIEVMASLAEQERLTIRKRQREGIEAAKRRGKHLGRPKMKVPENWPDIYQEWKAGNITAKEAMQQTGLKKDSFYRLAQAWNNS